MHTFLLGNLSNGGILELMMRFLKSMGRRFLLRWPPGLAEVVLSTYHNWRRHSASLPNPLLRDCSSRPIQVGLQGAATLFPGGGQLLLGAALGAFRAPEVEEPWAHSAQGCVGQGSLGR